MKKVNFATFAYETEGKTVDWIATVNRYIPIKPTNSKEITCTICKGSDHYAPYMYAQNDIRRVWVCGNPKCESMLMENIPKSIPRKD